MGEWAAGLPIVLDGKPFSFKNHEYLITPYSDNHPFQVDIKATQMGLSSRAMLRCFYWARFHDRIRGILYLFPSKSDVTDFSKGRFDPLIDDNPDSLGSWIKDTDAANIKKIWNSFLYFRGMRSRLGLKSTPADAICFDELDEAPQWMIDWAMARMSHSEDGIVYMLSNPTMPDYGIDAAFQKTDQQFFLLKCKKCNAYTNLVETFPDCLHTVKNKTFRACSKCGAALDISCGEWVAKKPRVKEKRGRQYSQLYSRYVKPEYILEKYRTTNNLESFFNLIIGIAYVSATNRLSVQEVLSCCGSDGMSDSDKGPCYMGVDQNIGLHVTVGKKHTDKRKAGKIVHLGVYNDWEELDRVMKNFKVNRCVVDAMPETRNARAFADRHPGRVYLCYYNDHQKGSYKWDDGQMIVQGNRTETLDASHKELAEGKIELPRKVEEGDIVQTFAEQCHNVAKKLEEDEDTGSKRYSYLKLGADHFRHSFNYEAMSRQSAKDLMFADVL